MPPLNGGLPYATLLALLGIVPGKQSHALILCRVAAEQAVVRKS
jgi:hypothetical protein